MLQRGPCPKGVRFIHDYPKRKITGLVPSICPSKILVLIDQGFYLYTYPYKSMTMYTWKY